MSTSMFMAGCAEGPVEVSADQPCEAIDVFGESIQPTGYPEGTIDVEYQYPMPAFNRVTRTEGEIVKDGGKYILELALLPDKLTNGFITDFDRTDAVVILDNRKLGRIGLTPNCISTAENEYGILTSVVVLPTAQGE